MRAQRVPGVHVARRSVERSDARAPFLPASRRENADDGIEIAQRRPFRRAPWRSCRRAETRKLIFARPPPSRPVATAGRRRAPAHRIAAYRSTASFSCRKPSVRSVAVEVSA